jgi:hypothetical protein
MDQIAYYFGEKKAFYFCWLIHYTSWLIWPSIIGLLIYLIQVSRWKLEQNRGSYDDATDSALNCLYSVCIAIWTTLLVESWKQKENWFANRWLVKNFEAQSFDRR